MTLLLPDRESYRTWGKNFMSLPPDEHQEAIDRAQARVQRDLQLQMERPLNINTYKHRDSSSREESSPKLK